ncbi:MAG: TPM domain-containing protein [Treponema sp.]|nr:TPM domain-containing protein [Treponema sp.]
MKKLNILLKLTAFIFLAAQAFAEAHLYDEANLLTAESKAKVESTLAQFSESHNVGIYVATIEDFRGSFDDVESASENFFDSKDLGLGETKDGILLFLSMGDRSYDLDTHGINTYCLSGDSERIAGSFLPSFRNDNWESGFLNYAKEVDEILTEDENALISARQKAMLIGAGIVLLISLILAYVKLNSEKAKLNNIAFATEAGAYESKGGVSLLQNSDVYTHTTTRTIHHQQNHSRSGGGGGGGHRHSSGHF